VRDGSAQNIFKDKSRASTILAELTSIVFFCSSCELNLPSAFKLYDDSQELFSAFESKLQSLETNLLSKISLINNSCQIGLDKVTEEKSASLQKVETLGVSITENHNKLQIVSLL